MSDLKTKNGLVIGVANKRSLAWEIARAADKAGAKLTLSYANERFRDNAYKLAESLSQPAQLVACDVTSDDEIKTLYKEVEAEHGGLDFLVHSVAFASREAISEPFLQTTRHDFLQSLDISTYSLIALARGAAPLMDKRGGGSILTLTYMGSTRVFPHYNVMGVSKAALEATVRYLSSDLGPRNIRANAISAGPIKTLAASGIGDFRFILKWNELNAPLKRNVSQIDIGNSALYLLSNLGSAVTGEIQHVDCGYHTVGMVAVDEAKNVSELLGEFVNNK